MFSKKFCCHRYHLLVIIGGENQKQKETTPSVSFLACLLTEPRTMLEISHYTLRRVWVIFYSLSFALSVLFPRYKVIMFVLLFKTYAYVCVRVCYLPVTCRRLLVTLWMTDVCSVLSPAARLWPLLWSQSHLIFGLSLFLLPSVLPALLSFPKKPAFSWCTWSRTATVLSFLPPAMLQA